jgi:hypothetical protein
VLDIPHRILALAVSHQYNRIDNSGFRGRLHWTHSQLAVDCQPEEREEARGIIFLVPIGNRTLATICPLSCRLVRGFIHAFYLNSLLTFRS